MLKRLKRLFARRNHTVAANAKRTFRPETLRPSRWPFVVSAILVLLATVVWVVWLRGPLADDATREPEDVEDIGQWVQRGPFSIMVDDVRLEGSDGGRKMLRLHIVLFNCGPGDRHYTTWRAHGALAPGEVAFSMEDMLGNRYQPFAAATEGEINSCSFPPGAYCTDVLRFNEPAPHATYLLLTLPHRNIGGTGKTVFKIHVGEIRGH